MLPLKVVLCCLETGEHLSVLEASLKTARLPKSYLLALPQLCCAVFQVLLQAVVTDHKLNKELHNPSLG